MTTHTLPVGWKECPACDGAGEHAYGRGPMVRTEECRRCHGHGAIPWGECVCGHQGRHHDPAGRCLDCDCLEHTAPVAWCWECNHPRSSHQGGCIECGCDGYIPEPKER